MTSRSVITIGKFDSVHRGHQSIISRARQLADQHQCKLVALSFDPDPATVLQPQAVPPRISSLAQKINYLQRAGVDQVVVLQPTLELLMERPEQFIRQIAEQYMPLAIVEGRDFRFGKGRQGDTSTLVSFADQYGFQVFTLMKMQVALSDLTVSPVSTSLIRWLIGRGRVQDAALCMGRFFSFSGPVVRGDRMGHRLGMPTVNLSPDAYLDYIVPADGVYAGTVELDDGREYAAGISVGVKPTFGNRRLTVEAHLVDFNDDLYDQTINMRFSRWIRDQYAFPDIDSLKKHLWQDVAKVIEWRDMGLLEVPSPRFETADSPEICI